MWSNFENSCISQRLFFLKNMKMPKLIWISNIWNYEPPYLLLWIAHPIRNGWNQSFCPSKYICGLYFHSFFCDVSTILKTLPHKKKKFENGEEKKNYLWPKFGLNKGSVIFRLNLETWELGYVRAFNPWVAKHYLI